MLKFKKWLKYILYILLSGIGLLTISIILFYYSVSLGFFGQLYTKSELKAFKNEVASHVYSQDKVLLGKYFDKNRTNITYDQIPPYVIHALISIEDARYFEHKGVDFRSLIRVLFKTILLGDESAGGGSTLSQQLLKNMYGRKNFGPITIMVNKTKEIILAQRLESVYTKEEILTLYLNTVPFGENIYGIGSAAQRFFHCTVSELSIDEGAILIGMLKANTYYNPRLHPDHALLRRNIVFQQMNKYGYLEEGQLEILMELPLELKYGNLSTDGIANYFLVQVRKEAQEILEELNNSTSTQWDIEKDGLSINTTLNNELQQYTLVAFRNHLQEMQLRLNAQYQSDKYAKILNKIAEEQLLRQGRLMQKDSVQNRYTFDWNGIRTDSISLIDSIKQSLTLLHAGLIGVDPSSGAIRIWVGGIDYQTQAYDQIRARRQLASTFKPILYAAALESGKMPCDYIDNSPLILTDYDNWSPQNYDHSVGGKYSLAAALALSMNIPTVRLLFEVGFEEVHYLWKKMGFEAVIKDQPSLALGTAIASLSEIALAYASFANGGFAVESHCISSITTPDGDTLYQYQPPEEYEHIITEKTSILMNGILQKAVNEGTGKSIRNKYNIEIPLAGKTGTSQNFSDAWFVAYTPKLVMATRVGSNFPAIHFSNGKNGSASRLALPLVAQLVAQAVENPALKPMFFDDFSPPQETYESAFNCEDYLPDSKAKQMLNVFKKKSTNKKKEENKAARKKKRLSKQNKKNKKKEN